MVRYKYTSQKGNLCNEDCAWAGEFAGYVIDGSSGLYRTRITPEDSDAKWFSHRIGAYLQKHLNSNRSISELLREGCAICLDEYLTFTGNTEINADALPSASIAAFRLTRSFLELYTLGDCAIFVQLHGNALLSIYDQTVPLLDAAVLEFMKHRSKELGISLKETASEASSLLRENRKKKNIPNGYWILDPYGEGIAHGDTVRLDTTGLRSITLMSDGFLAATPILYPTVYELLDGIENGLPEEIALRVLAELEADETMDKYPRLKIKDDASVVWYRL